MVVKQAHVVTNWMAMLDRTFHGFVIEDFESWI